MLPVSDDKKRLSCRRVLAASLLGAGLMTATAVASAAEPGVVAETTADSQQQTQAAAEQAATAEKNAVLKVTARQVEKKLELSINCAKQPLHTAYEVPGSGRSGIVVDLANAELKDAGALNMPPEFKIGLAAEAVKEGGQELLRMKFTLPKPYAAYTASRKENDIVVTVDDFFQEAQAATAAAPASPVVPEKSYVPSAAIPAASKDGIPQKDAVLDSQLPQLKPVGGGTAAAGMPSFNATGYDSGGKPISVDFFKIDLHNVFRLLGEISGANIVVAEGVTGTLTLALHEVPWEFALDIILNLKDLAKEQRHNTIVIYPKSKEFVWPERADAGLDIDVMGQPEKKDGSPIVIGQESAKLQGPGVAEARNFVALGRQAEKNGNLEAAVQLYEKALDLWSDKTEKSTLANRIAAIYLAKLDQNAKAAYFAKKALAANKKNSSAALNAAVAHANMGDSGPAQQYFDQSVSIGKPSREALLSYALFSERQQQPEAALRLLGKYSELYGESLDSMVARARVLDQQGRQQEADKAYAAILHAGFQVPQDLRIFIENRSGGQRRRPLPTQQSQER